MSECDGRQLARKRTDRITLAIDRMLDTWEYTPIDVVLCVPCKSGYHDECKWTWVECDCSCMDGLDR